ncbi:MULTISPECIES: hypothetical protein [unclassified Bifidobacterium]|uniref:hypothetical protein n=1 Tax=unclassified Bifidobacterium TaxID=2608897 RepID=UPI001125E985|nr:MULTISPECIES: hypothetical protein [unclassified Bifidobacterium]TPF78536.1 hypothetical protein BW09_03445 [Bifidobacterium sp. UTCIF-1]TPF80816.1 hypothetical protein BW08_02400 [Bifidobacterium sp. UTCIF-24]TPF82744.1 hypothetical protein BW12_03220 [Bifidobacterium sp. UTCIF-3]TPF84483.1 hypothetical protein BW07_04335 [Bifidobacterium sp. UTCIF-36]TPF90957.1 hypothetical protein BW10_01695 [Bifidobacterium sp. UTBIF-56]
MMKKIMALLATVAAVLGFGFAANTAMAEDYGATGSVTGSVATVTFTGLKAGAQYYVQADDQVVSNVEQVALKEWGPFTAKADGTLTVKVTLKAGAKTDVKLLDANKTVLTSYTVTAPATGNGAAPTVADTGASVAPYAVAVVLLAAAGVALFAVRKTSARR